MYMLCVCVCVLFSFFAGGGGGWGWGWGRLPSSMVTGIPRNKHPATKRKLLKGCPGKPRTLDWARHGRLGLGALGFRV